MECRPPVLRTPETTAQPPAPDFVAVAVVVDAAAVADAALGAVFVAVLDGAAAVGAFVIAAVGVPAAVVVAVAAAVGVAAFADDSVGCTLVPV